MVSRVQSSAVRGAMGSCCADGGVGRLWAEQIQMIIDRGADFTAEHEGLLAAFGRMWHFRSREGPTTRALNVYRGDHRGFEYLSPKRRLDPADLLAASPTLPRWIHLVCSPERAAASRTALALALARCNLVYEPIPDSCTPQNLQPCLHLLPHLAVFSPNHQEAASLLSVSVPEPCTLPWVTKHLAQPFIDHLPPHADTPALGPAHGLGPVICIRAGALGSVIGRKGIPWIHVPAYHTHPAKVVDVTGAGNAFLGGLTAGLSQDPSDLTTAALKASVSACKSPLALDSCSPASTLTRLRCFQLSSLSSSASLISQRTQAKNDGTTTRHTLVWRRSGPA